MVGIFEISATASRLGTGVAIALAIFRAALAIITILRDEPSEVESEEDAGTALIAWMP